MVFVPRAVRRVQRRDELTPPSSTKGLPFEKLDRSEARKTARRARGAEA